MSYNNKPDEFRWDIFTYILNKDLIELLLFVIGPSRTLTLRGVTYVHYHLKVWPKIYEKEYYNEI